jgi:hypothetical protein
MKKITALGVVTLFAVSAAASTIWDGTADTTWYTNNKSASVYRISTAEQLAGLERLVNEYRDVPDRYDTAIVYKNGNYSMKNKTIILDADIMLNDTVKWKDWSDSSIWKKSLNLWHPIGYDGQTGFGIQQFKGTFDGNGHVISGMYVLPWPLVGTSSIMYSKLGFFGVFTDTVEVKNLRIVASFVGNLPLPEGYTSLSLRIYAGGLVGHITNSANNVTITNCSFSGTVIAHYGGTRRVGGLIGYIEGGTDHIIRDCFTMGKIGTFGGGGTFSLGSLLGENNGRGVVANSYSNAQGLDESLFSSVCTFLGYNPNRSLTTINCYYASGEKCGVDADTISASPKTTIEMKQKSTYIGWDFDNVWTINPAYNDGYPIQKIFIDGTGSAVISVPRIVGSNRVVKIRNGLSLNVKNSAKLEVFDLKGKLVYKRNLADGVHSVSLARLPKGIYLARAAFGRERVDLRVQVR